MTSGIARGALLVAVGLLLLLGVAGLVVHDDDDASAGGTPSAASSTTISGSATTSPVSPSSPSTIGSGRGTGGAPPTSAAPRVGPGATTTTVFGSSPGAPGTTGTATDDGVGGPPELAFTGASSNVALGLALLGLAAGARYGVVASRSR